jgi:hypothetical protein
MVTTQYEEALRGVRSLSPDEQKRLLTQVAEQLEVSPDAATSILKLRGLGKEIWRNLDAQEYVERERASWNG